MKIFWKKSNFWFFFFFLLYNIVLVLPYINMHPPRVYMCSPSWTPFPPPTPYHPSGSSQCTSPKLPVSCIKPGLVIHFLYDIIHVLMPLSQIIPPPPPPLPQRPKDCSIQLCLFCCLTQCVLLGRKVMTNLDSIFKSRDITLTTKVCLVKAMVFPVVLYGCESWIVKKTER